MNIIAKNKRAHFDYFLSDKLEAGLVLQGTEVKSLRLGKVSIAESFITIDKNKELWINNMNIAEYTHGNQFNHSPSRPRKLLVNRQEIDQLHKKMQLQKLSLVPTMIYFKRSRVKVEIALAKGKKLYDKRQSEAKRTIERKIQQGKYE